MSHNSHQPELAQQIVQDLRALGGARAPEELWSRVQAELQQSGVVPTGRVVRGYFGRKSIAAAAALLIFSALSIFGPGSAALDPDQDLVVLAQPISAAARASFRARVSFKRVSPNEMTSFSKGLAGSMGSLLVEDDA